MYLRFYGFREEPFGSTPDPRFLYSSASHREAMASLRYSIETGRGFFALIAPPGMGKTTLLFEALEKYHESACTAFLFNTQCNSREFLRFLLSEVGIEDETDDLARLHRRFNDFLIANARLGRRFILIVDEAQNLSSEVLETIRLLSDFETSRSKLMQIVLAGQSELYSMLKRPNLSQLLQRISMISRIEPLTTEETREYVNHRLVLVGYRGEPIFKDETIGILARHSHGIPRLINSICFNALSLGYASGRSQIDIGLMTEAVADLPSLHSQPSPRPNLSGKQQRKQTSAQVNRVAPAGASSAAKQVGVPPAAARPNVLLDPSAVFDSPPIARPFEVKASNAAPVSFGATAPSLSPPATGSAPRPSPTKPGLRIVPAQSVAVGHRGRSSDPIPSVTAAYGRRGRRGTSFVNAALVVLLLIGSAAAGYFVIRPWVGSVLPSASGVNAASPSTGTGTESTHLSAAPVRTLTTDRDESQPEPVAANGPSATQVAPSQGQTAGASAETGSAVTDQRPPVNRPLAGRLQPTTGRPATWKAEERPSTEPASNGDAVIILPQLVERVHPEYPSAASRLNAEGEVVLTASVNEEGKLQNLRFMEGNLIFKQAALDAVSQWKYRPGTYNGKPAGMPVKIRLKFSPSE